MLAGRLHVSTGSFAVEEVDEPHAGPGQVRIAVRAAGVCLSDVHLIQGMLKPLHLSGDSVTLGHETAGVIDEVGAGVTGLTVGERVLLQAGEIRDGVVLTRGVDYDGGWAQFAVATAGTVVPIPDTLSFEQACFVPDAVSTPWAAITTTAGVRPARAVGVWGVGGLGAHAVQLLRMIGAAPIIAIDPLPLARERAVRFGADLALDPGDPAFAALVAEATGGAGLAYAFDFAGVAPVRVQATRALAKGGRLTLVGLTDQPLTIPDGTRFSYLEQEIRGHYGSGPEHVLELLSLVALGRVEFSRSVSGTWPLAEAAEAVRRLDAKEDSPIRLILIP
ncbi:zinc-binding dehydrogenase [Actinoplanes teichomyceticus]|uniref:D-arabinose 1-dehydrogenase-like Zn-dependent alcohol dehydrogenase n=1 Tax=Actinoplanes teichomyceticus TaxID=1867 RepID=A0A561VL47_ACTTI|nr:zinc-binding dehydrogenase [Actinoplanes teichomyceticus]TWG12317.1 D-arabinose 1-dehydrogenase-like Zn-dependent alcohol dehydrogenase [Actinoplanes teichomyceticus]GIF14257.1 alcohol dehydrogenase [Actinoplanes teichomyceticus]